MTVSWIDVLKDREPVLVTGAAGFIGMHVAKRLLEVDVPVIGIDNMNAYYSVYLKKDRLDVLGRYPRFSFQEIDIADHDAVAAVFERWRPRHVVHLAAQAGVRYSIDAPFAYADSNLRGFLSVLEACRRTAPEHLIYASSSSVYGGNVRQPFSVNDPVDHPVSLYAATKKANELMAHAYAHLYGLPATGLRFFTVYGPWGRPDMAYWRFTEAIAGGAPIELYNFGEMSRDFTYIDDVVEPLLRLLVRPARPDPRFDPMAPSAALSWAPHRVFNIGAARPEPVLGLVSAIESALGERADRRLAPMQPGDVRETWADVADLEAEVGFRPSVPLGEGVARFVSWWQAWRRADPGA